MPQPGYIPSAALVSMIAFHSVVETQVTHAQEGHLQRSDSEAAAEKATRSVVV